jgi:D-alanine-D-alanine ligase
LDTFRLTYPCLVKPPAEDASHGLTPESLVSDFAALKEQVEEISHGYGGSALVEEFADGREFNASILGNSEYTVLPVSEIVYSLPPGMPQILTFDAKWQEDSLYFQATRAVCPADIAEELQAEITRIASTAFRLLGCRGYARVDLRMDKNGQINVIEINPNPDISPGLGAARQAGAAGMTYQQFVQRIVELALEGKPQWKSRFAPCRAKTNLT